MPPAVRSICCRITRGDILKAGEFVDPKKVTNKDLLRALGSESSAVRALDYAEARSGDKGVTLDESSKSECFTEHQHRIAVGFQRR